MADEKQFKCLDCKTVIGEVVGVVLYAPNEERACLILIEGAVRCPKCFTARRFFKQRPQDSQKEQRS